MNNQINISFEIEDSYNIKGFRNFIKLLLSDDKYNVFIISNDDSSFEIQNTGNELGLPSSNIIICNFTNDKIQAITNNKIQIHFDNLQSVILLVDETTEAYGIMVTKNLNKYYLKPDYVITFERLLNKLNCDE